MLIFAQNLRTNELTAASATQMQSAFFFMLMHVQLQLPAALVQAKTL